MLAELWCDQKTRDKLGEAGLAEVTANLWAQDCQTCGLALGGEPPALCMDELTGYATAGLHHRRCRPPGWNDSSLIITASGDVLSWQACAILLPGTLGDQPDPRPALLVNPGLEQITLTPADGTWRPGYEAPFDALGLVPPGPELALNRPVRGQPPGWAPVRSRCRSSCGRGSTPARPPSRSGPPRGGSARCCSW